MAIPTIEKDPRVQKKTPESNIPTVERDERVQKVEPTPQPEQVEAPQQVEALQAQPPVEVQRQELPQQPAQPEQTAQDFYAQKQREGTLTQEERDTIIQAGKELGVEEAQKRLQETQMPTQEVQEPKQPTITIKEAEKQGEPMLFEEDKKAKELSNQNSEIANKTNELNYENQKKETEKVEKEAKMQEFQSILNAGASMDEVAKFASENPTLGGDMKNALRNYLKLSDQDKFLKKYTGMSTENMYAAVKKGEIVPTSEDYNMLPPEQRQALEQYMDIQNSVEASEKTDFSTPQYDMEMPFDQLMSKMFGGDTRKKIEELQNDDRLVSKTGEYNRKISEIEELDVEMEREEKRIRKKYAGVDPGVIRGLILDSHENLREEKRLALKELQIIQGDLASIETDINRDISLLEYEDAQNKQKYQMMYQEYLRRDERAFQVGMMQEEREYQSLLRSEQQVYEAGLREEEREYQLGILAFQEENKRFATQTQFDNQKILLEFQQELKAKDLSGGDYIDDGKGNLIYVKDGRQISVIEGLGQTISTTMDDMYEYTTKYDNERGIWTTLIRDKQTGEIRAENRNVDGQDLDYLSTLGTGQITSYGGSHDGGQGLDIDVNVGDPVYSPFSGEVVKMEGHPLYGYTIEIKDDATGNIVKYSHLDESLLYPPGTRFEKGAVIAKGGNTGNVLKMDGTRPTEAELAQGFGSHLDIVSYTPDGKVRTSRETEQFLREISKREEPQDIGSFTFSKVATFNSPTFKPENASQEELEAYDSFTREKMQVMGNKNANIEDVIAFSHGGGTLTATQEETLGKFQTVLTQVADIQDQIGDIETGPITGRLKSLNPYNADIQTLKAQLTGLVPNLARGVYGEVGVLTDADIRNYAQTIPNAQNTEEVNKAILAMNLKMLAGGYKRQLQNLASAQRDVSFYQGTYDSLMSRVQELESEIGIGGSSSAGNTVIVNDKEVNFDKYLNPQTQSLSNIYNNYGG